MTTALIKQHKGKTWIASEDTCMLQQQMRDHFIRKRRVASKAYSSDKFVGKCSTKKQVVIGKFIQRQCTATDFNAAIKHTSHCCKCCCVGSRRNNRYTIVNLGRLPHATQRDTVCKGEWISSSDAEVCTSSGRKMTVRLDSGKR